MADKIFKRKIYDEMFAWKHELHVAFSEQSRV